MLLLPAVAPKTIEELVGAIDEEALVAQLEKEVAAKVRAREQTLDLHAQCAGLGVHPCFDSTRHQPPTVNGTQTSHPP